MKLALMTLGLLMSTHAMAAVDYTYCQQSVGGASFGFGMEPAFTITDEGKIKPGSYTKSYKEDPQTRTETIVYGEKPMSSKAVIIRNEAGEIVKVIQSTDYDAPEMKSGVGSKRKMGMGIGYPMGGFGMGGYGIAQDMKTDLVTDFKIQNGKCVPSRSMMETKVGKNFERHFVSDLQLCRDIKQFFKKNPDAAACFGNKFNDAVTEVLKGHHSRNADVYKPEETKASSKDDPFAGYGQYPGAAYDGGGFNSAGMSYNGLNGGYGMFLDNMASVDPEFGQQSPLMRGQMILQYCEMPFGPMPKMIADEALFVVESSAKQAINGTSK